MKSYRKRFRESVTLAALLGPFLAVFGVFIAYPLVNAFLLSFQQTDIYSDWYNKFADMKFVGFGQYRSILFDDPSFWWSVLLTAYYAVLAIPTSIALSLTLALLLHTRLRGYRLFRGVFFLPNAFDVFVVGTIWLFLYNPTDGLLIHFFRFVGLESVVRHGLLNNPVLTLPCIAAAMVLKGAGFGMILFIAAMNLIPQSVFEAADVDGATPWQKIRHVTLPLLKPVILFLTITGIVGALNAFTEMYAMTSNTGGPSVKIGTQTLEAARVSGYYLFQTFENSFYGRASAISFILLIFALVVSYINFRLLRSEH